MKLWVTVDSQYKHFVQWRGIALNRPKQKENDQFAERDIATNFDIAATQIHVERFTGRVCNWGILNSIWPINRSEILSSTQQSYTYCEFD